MSMERKEIKTRRSTHPWFLRESQIYGTHTQMERDFIEREQECVGEREREREPWGRER